MAIPRNKMVPLNRVDISSPEQLRDAVKNASGRVLLRFYRVGCPACERLVPLWETQARAPNMSRVQFVSVNVQDNPELSGAFGIQSIPTIMAFDRGVLTGKLVGFNPDRFKLLAETGK